jgi:hypothetical protein
LFVAERQAEQIKLFKNGMTIEAKHVKKRDLANYISSNLIKRERKVSIT